MDILLCVLDAEMCPVGGDGGGDGDADDQGQTTQGDRQAAGLQQTSGMFICLCNLTTS